MKTYFKLNSIFGWLLIGLAIPMLFTKVYALTGTRDLEAYTQKNTNEWTDIILKNNDNADATDPLLDNIKGQWVKDAAEQGYQFAEGGRIEIGDGKLYSFQEAGGVSTDLLDPTVYVMERADTTRNDIEDQLQAKYHLGQGYHSSTSATLVVDGKEITQTIGEWFKTESFLTEFRYATGPRSQSKKDKQATKLQEKMDAQDSQLSQGFSIPSYNATTTDISTASTTTFSDAAASFITSNDIFVVETNNNSSGSASNIVTVAQMVNKCVSRCIASGIGKSACTKECNRSRCGCRDTDNNGVLEAVCEAGQFGKECLGVMSCNVRICDDPDSLKNAIWTPTAITNSNTNTNNSSSFLTPVISNSNVDNNISISQSTCPPELCSDTFYPGGLLGGLKCPGTQYCNKYWCKGNCLVTCEAGGNDPYGMCPDAGTVCCKPVSASVSLTLAQSAADACPSTYCKPTCDSLRENDLGHKSCNGFECCMPNYNLGTCSSLGGECVGGCEGTKILGRAEILCLQGGICCQKGTGSNIVSYCGCENGQPKCGSQTPNGLQCSTDSQCGSLLKCN